MEAKRHTLFVQYRASRAGAQTSLLRLVSTPEMAALNPAVLLAESGWLEDSLLKKSVPTYCSKWPSPRSLHARMGGMHSFAKKTVQQLAAQGIYPAVVIANDHQECPVALAIGQLLKVPVISILRSASMDERDYKKYTCSECTEIFTVGAKLQNKIQLWSGKLAQLYTEGFTSEELFNQHPKLPSEFPKKLLIVGTADPAKGFSDFFKALHLVEKTTPDFPPLECFFTSEQPDDDESKQLLSLSKRSNFNFIRRVNGLSEFARDFDFAIHPSRQETFGMTPIELILAGVPTLSTETGILDSIDLPDSWLSPPSKPQDLAVKLLLWYSQWSQQISTLEKIQENLRQRFAIHKTSAPFIAELKKILR